MRPGAALMWCFLLMRTVSGQRKVFDLTHTISHETLYWPGIPRFNFTILAREELDNHWLESNWFSTSEHGGTHLDGYSHMYPGHLRVHEIPPERLVGPGVVIDVTEKVRQNPLYQVLRGDITAWEHDNGRIPDGAVIMMNSGWGSRYPDRRRVLNTDTPEDPKTFRYPGWEMNTVRWLVRNRKVIVVGVDTPATDFGLTTSFPVHATLGRLNVSGLENLANLDQLPPRGMTVFVGVTKIYDGSGGPARVFALLDEEETPCSCRQTQGRSFFPIFSGSSAVSSFFSLHVLAVFIGFVIKK